VIVAFSGPELNATVTTQTVASPTPATLAASLTIWDETLKLVGAAHVLDLLQRLEMLPHWLIEAVLGHLQEPMRDVRFFLICNASVQRDWRQ
jgi:hypothetical protein